MALTTLGILLSLRPAVRSMQLAYKAGMYLIYVFCFAGASMASLDDLRALDASVAVFLFGTAFTIYLGIGAALPIDKSLTLGLF